MKKFSSFFKYFSDDSRVIEGVFKNRKIRLTQPWGMNDPLEFNPSLKFKSITNSNDFYKLADNLMPSIELFYRVQLIESQINAFGILSLTKQPLSFDMWSRYANGHKGFLIEFKPDFNSHPCMKSKQGVTYTVKKVKYIKTYQLDIESLSDENGDLLAENLRDDIFYKKSSRWGKEMEYRLVRPFTDIPSYIPIADHPHRDDSVYLFDFSLECIKSVTFGACMSSENKKTIIESCKNHGVEFYQSFIIRNQLDKAKSFGDVQLLSINEFPSLNHLYGMLSYAFIRDKPIKTQEEPINISNLEDLPYYEGNEEIVKTIYNNILHSEK